MKAVRASYCKGLVYVCCGSRKKLVTIKLDQDCDGGRGWAYRSTLLPMTCLLKNGSKGGGDFWSFLEKQYVLFETIHSFDDGNGRTGRIILNYFLISAGYPPVILKGDEENRKRYYKALEQGDSVLRRLTEIPFSRQDVRNALEDMNASLLEDLISESLRGSFDRILIRLLEEKEQLKLKPAQEVGRALNYSPDSIRTLISRGKFIAVKRGKEWFTHEKLLLKKNGGK